MKILGITCLLLFLIACSNNVESTQEEEKKEFVVHQHSEMAMYMHSIYDMHIELREEIMAGNIPDTFPERFLDIKTAELANFFDRDASFDAFAGVYLEQIRFIYDTTVTEPLKERYNSAVNVCLACHQTTCLGPIPRIKKLLIP